MKLNKIIMTMLMLVASIVANAEGRDAIMVYADGVEKTFLLSQAPKIYYNTVDGVKTASVTVDGETTPAVSVQLVGDATMKILYVSTTDIDAIRNNQPLVKDGKVIKYGKVVILRNGKQYDINGVELSE